MSDMSDETVKTVDTVEEAIVELFNSAEAVEVETEDGDNIPCEISTDYPNE